MYTQLVKPLHLYPPIAKTVKLDFQLLSAIQLTFVTFLMKFLELLVQYTDSSDSLCRYD